MVGLLKIQYPDGSREEFAVQQDVIAIGRDPQSQLVLRHESVSRNHARLCILENKFYLEDLDSSWGTYIDGRRLPAHKPTLLRVGQDIRMGEVRLDLSPAAGLASGRRLQIAAALGVGGTALALMCLALIALLWWLRTRQSAPEAVCDQPAMTVIQVGGVSQQPGGGVAPMMITASPAITGQIATEPVTATVTVETAPQPTDRAVQPILSTAFLELPFPYDGGNVNFGGTPEQFRKASQIYSRGGRINSYFDHLLPLYPQAYSGKEPEQFGGKLLIFDGSLRADVDYSGHPGYDFKTFEYRQPTTPLFAAADGVVDQVGEHSASGALYVYIVHHVEGVGDFRTTYWHLHPDEYFEAMRGRVGQEIVAGTRIGTMGNTGFSTGHHLHFEVRFDRNGDGQFSEGERVDPYGYVPSAEYPRDPWVEKSAPASQYLWLHPLGLVAEVPPSGGGALAPAEGTGGELSLGVDTALCAPQNSLPPGGRLYWSWGLDPPPSQQLQGVGKSAAIGVVDPGGAPVVSFDLPIRVVIPFDQADLECVDPASLKLYWIDPQTGIPQELETWLDLEAGSARANASRPGKFSLMGRPTCDLIAPQTEIQASGRQSPTGAFYEQVTVSLQSSDPSGVQKIEYSLDSGDTWSLYQGPFTVEPSGVPSPDYEMDEQFFGLGPGRTLVLAAATDGAGNIEYPPAFLGILIDPSQAPQAGTDTPTPTPTQTLTPSATSPACARQLIIETSANCRTGPGTIYPVRKALAEDITLDLLGQNQDSQFKWWLVALPDSSDSCWVSAELVSIQGDTSPECVPQIDSPPTLTLTTTPKTPKPPTTNQPPPAPTDLFPPAIYKPGCVTSIDLSWAPVSDSDGIQVYQWQLQQSVGDYQATYVAYTSGQTASTGATVNLDCGHWYRWRVRAVDGSGLAGPYSEWHLLYIN
ncbi:MAG: FHA domain-containing protein [Anaerolineales bacterium]|nr:FHA domain-containing protein [Anaerolineales bacterium]